MHANDYIAQVQSREVENLAVDGHLFVCTDINFTGTCASLAFVNGVCNNLPPAWTNSISSLGAEPGWLCTFWM